jgi:starch synthase
MPPNAACKVLLAASEVVGFAKTGGLADVAGSLPPALARRGHQCAAIVPLYRSARHGKLPLEPTGLKFNVSLGQRTVQGGLWRSRLPDSDVPVFLVEQPEFFERDDAALGRTIYQFTPTLGPKRDYPDNCARFTFFCRAVFEAMRLVDFWPDVLHANDWQTGLLPVYLREIYRRQPGYARMRTLFTIHNLAFQGRFWHWDMNLTGLDWRLFNMDQLEFYGDLSFLKAGVVFADLINTVSPTYAREIQTPYYGCGMQGVLYHRRDRLSGIVNGVDYAVWNPESDRYLAANYGSESVMERKPACKAALQEQCRLDVEPRTPLLGMVSRLTDQKGVDLIAETAESLIDYDCQIVVLGQGDQHYERSLQAIQARHPRRFAVTLALNEKLAHQIYAGADIFLMPSQFEPCGLSQLYSLKYGTVPLVRATGGLADTVVDCTPETVAAERATGFSFIPHNAQAFRETVQRGVSVYRHQPERWSALMKNCMRQDWSWDKSAAEYERLYERLTYMRAGDIQAAYSNR